MTIRVGLIGAGRMGATLAHHLAFTVAAAELAAVADLNGPRARELAARCRVPDIYQDADTLLARPDIAAVVIATPTHTHVPLVQAAAAQGKNILVEKPLALTVAGCDAALAAVAAAGVQLQVAFMRRYDPAYVAARQHIEAGTIGQPVMFKAVGRDPGRTSLEYARRENSGGLIADMGIHDFDLARWLMDSEVERVHSEGSCLVYPELATVGDIDNAVVNLRFANGAVGNVDVSRNAVYGYDIRTEIIGSEGSLFVGDLRQTPLLLLQPDRASHDTAPGFMVRFATAYAAELGDFVAAVEAGRPVAVGGPEARAATAIAVAATLSLDEGRPVNLSEVS